MSDWNEAEPEQIGTSSIDMTSTIWDIDGETMHMQLIETVGYGFIGKGGGGWVLGCGIYKGGGGVGVNRVILFFSLLSCRYYSFP
ncbi:hypothetical protein Vadar_025122 [Vaccinium darrowii]|uniref:Uncharacterized protein n=1 Tax=Vaccinium darrowii TaxID=229202 RepID=A0ACB7ZNV2_9ERIC|nr:hypothetical protein Vadar_025122 [Vaccinium darrowii]